MQEYKTNELYSSAFLSIILKIEPSLTVDYPRVFFTFPASDVLYRALNEYNSGARVNALEYSEAIKKLRGRMLTEKKMANGGTL